MRTYLALLLLLFQLVSWTWGDDGLRVPCNVAPNDKHKVHTKRKHEPRFAYVASACAGEDYVHSGPLEQLRRANALAASIKRVSELETVLLTAGFTKETGELDPWNITVNGTSLSLPWDRVLAVPMDRLGFLFRDHRFDFNDTLRPQTYRLQSRRDGACTTLKFSAWALLEYDGLFHSDTDICLHEDPVPYLHQFCSVGEPFLAIQHRENRQYLGANAHFTYLQPDYFIFEILTHKAKSGDFVPFTNTEQDVIETLFAPHHMEQVKRRFRLRFPAHKHSKTCGPPDDYRLVGRSSSTSSFSSSEGGAVILPPVNNNNNNNKRGFHLRLPPHR